LKDVAIVTGLNELVPVGGHGRDGHATEGFWFALQQPPVGDAVLTIQHTVGGMGSSNPGANCAALFLD